MANRHGRRRGKRRHARDTVAANPPERLQGKSSQVRSLQVSIADSPKAIEKLAQAVRDSESLSGWTRLPAIRCRRAGRASPSGAFRRSAGRGSRGGSIAPNPAQGVGFRHEPDQFLRRAGAQGILEHGQPQFAAACQSREISLRPVSQVLPPRLSAGSANRMRPRPNFCAIAVLGQIGMATEDAAPPS